MAVHRPNPCLHLHEIFRMGLQLKDLKLSRFWEFASKRIYVAGNIYTVEPQLSGLMLIECPETTNLMPPPPKFFVTFLCCSISSVEKWVLNLLVILEYILQKIYIHVLLSTCMYVKAVNFLHQYRKVKLVHS